jgi:carboxyl-terminal processing protease
VIFLSAAIVSYGLIGGILKKASAGDDNYGQLGIFNEVLHKIRNEYVESPNLERTFRGALHGMLEALDPYSSFVEASAYRNLGKQAEGGASVGLHLAKRLGRLGYAYVVAVTPGGPAAREGLRTGDLVESIGDIVTTQLSSWEANQSLLGSVGSEVTLRVVRARRSEPVEVKLIRVLVSRLMPSGEIVEPGIGLLKFRVLKRAPPNRSKLDSKFSKPRESRD